MDLNAAFVYILTVIVISSGCHVSSSTTKVYTDDYSPVSDRLKIDKLNESTKSFVSKDDSHIYSNINGTSRWNDTKYSQYERSSKRLNNNRTRHQPNSVSSVGLTNSEKLPSGKQYNSLPHDDSSTNVNITYPANRRSNLGAYGTSWNENSSLLSNDSGTENSMQLHSNDSSDIHLATNLKSPTYQPSRTDFRSDLETVKMNLTDSEDKDTSLTASNRSKTDQDFENFASTSDPKLPDISLFYKSGIDGGSYDDDSVFSNGYEPMDDDLMIAASSFNETTERRRNMSRNLAPSRSRLPVLPTTTRLPSGTQPSSRRRGPSYRNTNMTEDEVKELLTAMRSGRAASAVMYPANGGAKRCTNTDKKSGECIALTECQEALDALKSKFPTICSWEGEMPIVCCPKSETAGRKLQVPGCGTRVIPGLRREVRQVARSLPPGFIPDPKVSKDSNKVPTIAGGVESQPGAWPWMAGIYTRNFGVENFLCGGAIMTDRYIVTAAHCFGSSRGRQPARYAVRVGSLKVREGDLHTIDSITIHPQYRPREHYNDLAVVRVKEPIRVTNNIRPICLPAAGDSNDYVGRNVTVIGWGDQDFGGRRSSVLREVTVKVIQNNECDEAYAPVSGRNIPQGITRQFICAGVAEGGKDACQRDSGGPLMLPENGAWTLVGIVSFGFQCAQAGYPGVYTRASNFIDWLEEVTNIADVASS